MPERAGKAPQLREKSWGEAQRTGIWIFSKRCIITACGSVRAVIRRHTLRYHNGDSLRARSIPTSLSATSTLPYRVPPPLRHEGWTGSLSPDKRELDGINYSRAQSLD